MIQCKCEQCGQAFPMNQTLRLAGRVLCDACCEQALETSDTPQTDLERQFDPTICANCQKDNGTDELSRLAGAPVCQTCEAFFRNRPFPTWTKLALAAVVALVVVSFLFNMRFFRAYGAVRGAFVSYAQGDVNDASNQMASAAARVPECEDIRVMADYMEGVALLAQDKSVEALAAFRRCEHKLPAEYQVDLYMLHAQSGMAFDAGDYDEFLEIAQRYEQKVPDHYMGKAMLASAWACKHAQSGDLASRVVALDWLDQARNMAGNDPQFTEYETRILHRIHSRQIIEAEEFHRRFPDGWTPQEE